MSDNDKMVQEAAKRISKEFADGGMIVEAGWVAFHIVEGIQEAPNVRTLIKDAYYAGAEHLFSSIMATLDEGLEPTDADLKRIDLIHKELQTWVGAKQATNRLRNVPNEYRRRS